VEGWPTGRVSPRASCSLHLSEDEDLLGRPVERANERIEDGVPSKQRELAAAKDQVTRLQSEHEALVERLLAAPKGMVPASFWQKAKDLEAQVQGAESVAARLAVELANTRSKKLSVETCRATLLRFREVWEATDALQRADLLAYLLDGVEITGSQIKIALLGNPEAGRLDVFADRPQLGQPMEWLPVRDWKRTADAGSAHRTIRLEARLKSKPRSGKSRGRIKASRAPRVHPLERAEAWGALLEDGVVNTRAELARHLGVSRARVTQVLAVLSVRSDVKEALLRAEQDRGRLPERLWRQAAKLQLHELQEWGLGIAACEH